ncbi:hypothetical protein F4777DRAFT_343815 [Nemania sp. FL0916]|nr:hypothetical protein F4777DRAFT_343815 [Nemania sp. FL0916]
MSAPIFSSSSKASLGSLGIESFIPLPPLPNIIAEWAAILPLVCHLATQRDDYITTGDIALRSRLSVGLFPRLGTLSGLARLLERKNKYLDQASTKSGSGRAVWDVSWGSVFPCANGAAFTAISKYLISQRDKRPTLRMPEKLPVPDRSPQTSDSKLPKHLSQSSSITSSVSSQKPAKTSSRQDDRVRRYQVLHVYKLDYCKPKLPSLRQRANRFRLSVAGRLVWFATLLILAIILGLLGSYGSSALVVISSVSELVAQSVTVRKPYGYLKNNETHDACMLVASHQNATEWHLYIGDRGIADTLLNKPMFVLPEGRSASITAKWFRLANLLQLAAMTFVAAQKGWDGVSMVVLLAAHWAFRWLPNGQSLAGDWVDSEGITADVRSYEFGGRHPMIGAIQIFAGNMCTRWMDDILVPHPRREAWLKRLRGEQVTEQLSPHDIKWLKFASEASLASANVLKDHFGARERCDS